MQTSMATDHNVVQYVRT